MSIQYIVAHRKDPNNVGDIASNPLQYFLPQDEYQTIDVTNLKNETYDSQIPLILGGGGLLSNPVFGDVAAEVLTTPDRQQLQTLGENEWQLVNHQHKRIHNNFRHKYRELIASTLEKIPEKTGPKYVWGAGHNDSVDAEKIKYSRALSEYRAVGIRDDVEDSRFDWVPCASCMLPSLRGNYPIKNDVIWFEHKKQLIKNFGNDSIPRFVNSGSNIDQTIEILGSANIILTNSYHGAYWGMLLGKRVVVVDSWSTKFSLMKHKPAFNNKKISWQEAAESAQIYQGALDECIDATQKFWERIR